MLKIKLILFVFTVLSLSTSCGQNKKQELAIEDPIAIAEKQARTAQAEDSVYSMPYNTALLENFREFHQQNNKFADWPADNKKMVIVRCIAKKDGTTSDAKIARSSNEDKLDEEALRLVGIMKLKPAINESGEKVNSNFVIPISFPTEVE